MRNTVLIILVFIAFGFVFSGCGRSSLEEGEDARVVARINNYELTVSDFKEEIDPRLAMRYLSKDPLKAKEELLENLITKKVLLQEAQKQNFDKDKAFMKEIERYWEQTLLKLLLKKKSKEFSSKLSRKEAETAFEEWVADLRKKAKVLIDREILDSIEINRN